MKPVPSLAEKLAAIMTDETADDEARLDAALEILTRGVGTATTEP